LKIAPTDHPTRYRYRYTRVWYAPTGEGKAIAVKEEKIELEGEIVEALRDGKFRIALDNGHETLGYTAGKMRRYRIRINPGDRIRVELSPYDLQRGRIVYRYR
jgi:translation initiation factor IF-1